ncbi:MAG: DUF4197 domain-containing protein [Gammaproteobacteria bacterium HGW-Gammaproteobacteria-2]|jgi:hypothetical protein|nr:MAG: DUF4197 domain-containing protein [Gammaproteobacteria bacterium HGW-Gammaproteobacteria-2]
MRTAYLLPFLGSLTLALSAPCAAQSLSDRLGQLLGQSSTSENSVAPVGEADAAAGVKEALAQGTRNAVLRLGRTDGFLADEAVRIATPKSLRKATKLARKFGAGASVDAFEISMNRAAEQAVPAAADIFADTVRAMTVKDALDIVRGSDDAGTQYFRKVSEDRLRDAFLPIVSKATANNDVTQRYKTLTEKTGALAGAFGAGNMQDIDGYVTDKALDGLFHHIAEEEKAIRNNPLKRGSDLLKRVFGG